MKQTLLYTLFSFIFSSLVFAATDSFSDKIAVIGSPALSSDPCSAIDKKLMRLDAFMRMVNNTSTFHLEEKASALSVPGITVSNNKKKMLRDAKKKHEEYVAEHQKYGCETPVFENVDTQEVNQNKVSAGTGNSDTDSFSEKMAVLGSPSLSSEPCSALDKKFVRLNEFMMMVNHTSAFHLEEKASALRIPGITISNNKKKMLRDAKKKHTEYVAEYQKYGCGTPKALSLENKSVETQTVFSSSTPVTKTSKPMKKVEAHVKAEESNAVYKEERVKTPTVPKVTEDHKVQMLNVEQKSVKAVETDHAKSMMETSAPSTASTTAEKKIVVNEPIVTSSSSNYCEETGKELIDLYGFMIMLNNTSAFHLEEKASALSVPGITVSNNKKKMLRDAKKKRTELLEDLQKHGCVESQE